MLFSVRLMNISGKIIQSYTDANVQRPSVAFSLDAFGQQIPVEVVNETVLVKQEVWSLPHKSAGSLI